MRTWIRTGSLSGWLIGSLAFTACTADTSTTGDLAIELALLDGTRIDEVAWVIRRVGMEPMAGIVNTSAPGATASVEVFGIPPATGYTVSMTATSADGETSCSGSADFEVALGAVTEVTVMLNCKPGSELGGVRVDGRLNICADLVKVVVAPLQTSVGSEFRVSSRAEDAKAMRFSTAGPGLAARLQTRTPRRPPTPVASWASKASPSPSPTTASSTVTATGRSTSTAWTVAPEARAARAGLAARAPRRKSFRWDAPTARQSVHNRSCPRS